MYANIYPTLVFIKYIKDTRMPKENTHLFFARTLQTRMVEGAMKNTVQENLSSYYLGSIAPDILFYSKDHSLCSLSEAMHGVTGEPTNTLILNMLDAGPSHGDLAFIAGYISHCVLDIFFHPVIYYLSGNYYDNEPEKSTRARYMHRYLETRLDLCVASPVTVQKNIATDDLQGLIFGKTLHHIFGLQEQHLRKALRRQISMNRLFMRRLPYHILRFTMREPENLGLFYANVPRRDRLSDLDGTIEYRDIIDGKILRTSYAALLEGAAGEALKRINGMNDYIEKIISVDELRRIIPGESLDTGRIGLTARNIRYTKNHQL
ncbi:MAG: hypothetical protein CVV44_18830 [Spirochaetae bacterium HGW-Spirochaetae-1]|jgi:hypothetical protein|nr:MAG: hypothetical protein CVV44_18830 [Spirochaetae bacterium HGW-Spirochaetae-1]